MRITMYLHGSKETCWEKGMEAGLTGEALNRFRFTGYEHKIEYEVNLETGESIAVKFDDREIAPK